MDSTCIVCGKPKRRRFWICKDCAVKYGAYNTPYRNWPEWLRKFIKYARLLEARDRKYQENCIVVDQAVLEKIIDDDSNILY